MATKPIQNLAGSASRELREIALVPLTSPADRTAKGYETTNAAHSAQFPARRPLRTSLAGTRAATSQREKAAAAKSKQTFAIRNEDFFAIGT